MEPRLPASATTTDPILGSNLLALAAVLVLALSLGACRDAKDACQRAIENGPPSSCRSDSRTADIMACRMGAEEFGAQLSLDRNNIPEEAAAQARCAELCGERYGENGVTLGNDPRFAEDLDCRRSLLAACKTACTLAVRAERSIEYCNRNDCYEDYPAGP
jgi:hypothetical protein